MQIPPEQIVHMVQQYAVTLAELVAAFTVITAITPTRHDNRILDTVLRICNILAGNVAKNKNGDADKKLEGKSSTNFEEHA